MRGQLRPLHLGLLDRLADLDAEDAGAWHSFGLLCGRDFAARKPKAPMLSELRAWGMIERHPEVAAYRITDTGREVVA